MKGTSPAGAYPSVFISYSRANQEQALTVDAALKAHGLRTFIDEERVDDTADFEFTIYDALRSEVSHVVVVLTEGAASSRWVRFEVLVAERSGKEVILYRRPEWPLPAYWERWSVSQAHDIPELVARVCDVRGTALARSMLWNLATYPTPEFVGRASEVLEIERRLTAEPLPLVLCGLGGVGKTQLALEHVFRRHEDYDLVWWVRAAERATLLTDLAALGLELDLPGADPERVPETAESVRQYLSGRDRYLLVLDSASNPEDVAPLVPNGHGHCLLTSRRMDWPWGKPLVVSTFDEGSSIDFLKRRTKLECSPAMEEVADRLGGLPLALAQAGAYVVQKRITFAEYSERLAQSKSGLMEAGALIESNARVASTWDLSFAEAQAEAPEAWSVMSIASFLAPEGIPRDLVAPEADQEGTEGAYQVPSSLSVGSRAALRALSRYSLIALMPHSFSVHALVQDVVREGIQDGNRWLRVALGRLSSRLPPHGRGEEFANQFEALRLHVLSATRHAAVRGAETRLSMGLLLDIADDMVRRSLLVDGRESLERALGMGEEKFGETSPVLATVLNSLGLACDFAGDFPAAERAYLRGIEIARQSSSQWELIQMLQGNLGALYQNMNEPKRARRVLEPVLVGRERRGGTEVLATRQKLGQTYMAEGRLDLAEAEFLKILKLRQSGKIQEKQELAQSYADLGQLYGHKEEWDRALDFFSRAVDLYLEEQGEESFFLGITRYNRSAVYTALGRFSDALLDLEAARLIVSKAAGEMHPYLAAILFDTADLRRKLGDTRELVILVRSVVAICKAHPEVQPLRLLEIRASVLLAAFQAQSSGGGKRT